MGRRPFIGRGIALRLAVALLSCLLAQLGVLPLRPALAQQALCAQGRGCEDWVAVHKWDVSGTGFARSIAFDSVRGAVYATGGYGPSFFDGNMETVAYPANDGDDGVFGDEIDEEWIATHDAGPDAEGDLAWDVATSPTDGSVFMVGDVKSLEYKYTDWAVVALGPDGRKRWVSTYRAPLIQGEFTDLHTAKAIAVSPDGETIYVGGRTPQHTLGGDYTTIAYDANTGEQLWLSSYNGSLSAYDEIKEVVVSPDGTRVFVSGESWGKNTSFDLVTVAYDAATGEQLWLQSYDAASQRELFGGAVLSPDGSRLFVTGGSVHPETAEDYATIAYDTATGMQLWVSRYDRVAIEGLQPGEMQDTQARTDRANDVAVDPTGRFLAVTGRSSLAGYDFVTVLYDVTDGGLIWSRRFQGTYPGADDSGNAVAFSAAGTEVIATGMATHPTTSPTRNADLATLWYSTEDGTLTRTAQWDGISAEDEGEAIVVDPSGRHVYVTGRTMYGATAGSAQTAQFVTLAYETTPEGEPTPSPTPTNSASPTSTPDPSPNDPPEPLIPRLDLPIETHRVSVSSDGAQGNARAEYPTMSGDGRYVVFHSTASTLVPNDTNDAEDVFVHDRVAGATTRVSVNAAGEQAPGGASGGSISRNGRYVVFYSGARNMVPDGRTGVFRKDIVTGDVELAAFGSFTIPSVHAISDDGRYIVYSSGRTDIVPGVGPPQLPGDPSRTGNHVYVVDMETDTHKLVNVDTEGNPGTLHAQNPSISGNGHVAVFETRSPLDPRDTNGLMSVYAHNHVTNTTEWLSTNNYGEPNNDNAWRPRANYDGSVVAFDSTATNLVPREVGTSSDVFLRDLEANRTEKVSVSSTGAPPNDSAFRSSISSDGRFVAYWTRATNQAPGRDMPIGDVYLHDRVLGTTERVSIPAGGGLGSNTSHVASLSGDATAVSFMSFADDLVADDTNDTQDVFARQIGPSIGFMAPLKAEVGDDAIAIEGITRTMGARLSRSSDPSGDLVADEDTSEWVGDISGVDVSYRAEETHELLFNVSFDDLPFPVFGVASPGTSYAVSFRIDGRRYEIRMNGAEDIALFPTFTLHSCEPVCVPQNITPGAFGTTGHEIQFAAALGEVGAEIGSTITDVRAYAGFGSTLTGVPAVLDDATAPDSELPSVTAAVALEPAGTAVRDADFKPVDAPQDGVFVAGIPRQGVALGSYEAFARVCIADACGYGAAPVTIGSDTNTTTSTSFTTRSQDTGQYSDATLFEARVVDSDGDPVADRELTFELSGAESPRTFTATTDGDGIASVTPTLTDRPGSYQLSVRHTGDEAYDASANTSTFVVTQEDSATTLTIEGKGKNRTLTARLADLDADTGIAGRTIAFYGDGEHLGSATTNTDGIATIKAPPRYRGGKHDFEARFDGDDYYISSSDRRQT